MVGTVKMWQQGTVVVMATTLIVAPVLATTCATACLHSTAAPDSDAAGSTAHGHHGSTSLHDEMLGHTKLGGASVHECRDHDAIQRRGAIPPSDGTSREGVFASEEPLPFPLAGSQVIARHIRSTSGPPGLSGSGISLVLRL